MFKYIIILFILCLNTHAKVNTSEIDKACVRYNAIDCDLVKAIVWHESNNNELAFNPERSGSYGLGQVQCTTAKMLGLKYSCDQLFKPMINLRLLSRPHLVLKETLGSANAVSFLMSKVVNMMRS